MLVYLVAAYWLFHRQVLRVRFSQGLLCWMAKSTGRVTGSLLDVPTLLVPTDTPTLVPPYCSQFTNPTDCRLHVNDGCAWDFKATVPYCAGP